MLDLFTCTILPVRSLRHATNGQDTLYLLTIQDPVSVPRDRGLCASLNLLDTIGIAR
jgi:hypothetical protein